MNLEFSIRTNKIIQQTIKKLAAVAVAVAAATEKQENTIPCHIWKLTAESAP